MQIDIECLERAGFMGKEACHLQIGRLGRRYAYTTIEHLSFPSNTALQFLEIPASYMSKSGERVPSPVFPGFVVILNVIHRRLSRLSRYS